MWHIAIRRFQRGAHAAAVLLAIAAPAMAEPAASLITGSLPPAHVLEPAAPSVGTAAGHGHLLVLGFAGDLGFTGDGDLPSPDGSVKHGLVIPWSRLAAAVTPLLTADANFANLETVIAGDVPLSPIEKQYNFLGNSAGLAHAVAMGISVLTAANNHSGDFGAPGIVETLRHLADARTQGLRAFAGLGIGADRYRPDVFRLDGVSIGIAAIGLGINHAGADGPGQPLYASAPDFDKVIGGLATTGADVRVLSAHYGVELVSFPAAKDEARFRRAVDSGAAQIVFGHHSHVPSGVEVRNGGVIFYGLGNFMHSGTQNMSRYGACRDFGLYAKVYVWSAPGQPPMLRAVELVPLHGMHAVPVAVPAPDAARRIAIINAMNSEVAGPDQAPVRFEVTNSGSGLACFGNQQEFGDELTARCRAAEGPRQVSPLSSPLLLTSCGLTPAAPAAPPVLAAAERSAPPVPRPRPGASNPASSASADKPKRRGIFPLKLLD